MIIETIKSDRIIDAPVSLILENADEIISLLEALETIKDESSIVLSIINGLTCNK